MGPDTVLSKTEEKEIVEWCYTIAKSGFPRKMDDLLNTVQVIVKDKGVKTPFKGGRPEKKWYASFLRRNLELAVRTPENLSKGRAIVTKENIKKWFLKLKEYLKSTTGLIFLMIRAEYLMAMKQTFRYVAKS